MTAAPWTPSRLPDNSEGSFSALPSSFLSPNVENTMGFMPGTFESNSDPGRGGADFWRLQTTRNRGAPGKSIRAFRKSLQGQDEIDITPKDGNDDEPTLTGTYVILNMKKAAFPGGFYFLSANSSGGY
ncbi:MAG: hypothetical protein R2864_05850 [Syntrophotaleaceae bacterium]